MTIQQKQTTPASDVTAIVTAMTDDEKFCLPETLQAVLLDASIAQVILCYDASNNWITSTIQSYLQDERIQMLPLPLMNIGAIRNRAVEHTTSKWLAFCDGDDVWLHNKTLQQHSYAHKNNLDFVGAGHFLTNESGKIQAYGFSMYIPMPSTWLVKTEIMKKYPFNEQLSRRSDGDWWIRTHNKIKKGKFPKILLKYRVRLESVSMLSKSKKRKALIIRIAQIPMLGSTINFFTLLVWQSTKHLNYIWLSKWVKQV